MQEKIFRALSPSREQRRNGMARSRQCGRAGLVIGKGNHISDFLQEIVAPAGRSLGRSHPRGEINDRRRVVDMLPAQAPSQCDELDGSRAFNFTATTASEVIEVVSLGAPFRSTPVELLGGVSLAGGVPEPAT